MGNDVAVSRPNMRRRLEADLKLVAAGARSKDDVIAENLQRYRTVFGLVIARAAMLDTALEAQLGPRTGSAADIEGAEVSMATPVRQCPRCHRADQILKKTRGGNWIIGCGGYPECNACLFLGATVLNAESANAHCACGALLLQFTFAPGAVPPALASAGQALCVFCDDTLR